MMMLACRALAAAFLLALASCGGSSGALDCTFAQPITVAPGDVLTPETARQILTHDLQVRAVCGR